MRAADNLARSAEDESHSSAMRVGPANDAFEREADANAQRITGSEPAQSEASTGSDVQRKEEGAGVEGGAVSQEFAQSVTSAKGKGAPLPGGTLDQMNAGFGADFSNVRVHADSESEGLNRSINARAFTSGSDVFFRPSEYNPDSKQGQQTLAHELTHVVQQGGAQQGIQRQLMSAAEWNRSTKLFLRKGKSHQFFARLGRMLDQYNDLLGRNKPEWAITILTDIKLQINAWKARGAKSSRYDKVMLLLGAVENEETRLNQQMVQQNPQQVLEQEPEETPPGGYLLDFSQEEFEHGRQPQGFTQNLSGDEFTDENETSSRQNDQFSNVSGHYDRQQVVNYNFGVEEKDGKYEKTGTGWHGYDRFEGVFKPQTEGKEQSKREVAMKAVDKLLGANVIPPTFISTHKGEEGVVAKKINGITGSIADNRDRMLDPEDKHFNQPIVRQGLSKLFLLDLICGNVSRNPGNYVLELDGGRVKGVYGIGKNDKSFGTGGFNETQGKQNTGAYNPKNTGGGGLNELTEIDKNFAQRIIQLAQQPNVIRDALRDLLNAQQVQAVVERIIGLSEFLQPMINNNDPRIITQWQ